MFFDGLGAYQAGRFDDAEQRFLASLALVPGRVSTLVNLAATRLELARPLEALALAEQVLAAEPDNFDAWFHRANALARLGRLEEALASYDKLLALDGGLAEPWLRHGQTLERLNRHPQALSSYDRALAIEPGMVQAWSQRGGILRETQRLAEAAQAYEQAIAHGGDAELNGYYLGAVGAARSPATAPRHYVRALFDDYAGEFDTHLLQVLHYRAHTVLVGTLESLARGRYSSAVDLGCGTGLCGPLVKPMAQRLTGVDLSARMLDKARALGVYDHLERAEVVEYLRGTAAHGHDLILAADVFIYVGDLAPVFAAAHAALEPAGVFCFSAEAAGSEANDFELLPSLRYAHAQRYLRELAARHGFELLALVRAPMREDQRKPVEGLFVYLAAR